MFYVMSNLDEELDHAFLYKGAQYCLYGDSGYNSRSFLEVPFMGASLSIWQKEFNEVMSKVIVTIEWVFIEV